MKLPLLNTKKSKEAEVSGEIFGQNANPDLVSQFINGYIENSHQGTKAQKNRSQVSGGGKKPWRQKGTGRARAGTSRSPIWKGGGVTFAARSKSSEPKKINRKMYKSAMRSILSNLAKENKIFISQDLELASPKTKELSLKLKEIGFEKGLIVYKELSDNMRLASRNIANLEVIGINSLNPISLLKNNSILIDNDCLKNLEELYT